MDNFTDGWFYRLGQISARTIFAKVLRPVVQHLRDNNMKVVLYVDDFFLCSSRDTIEYQKDWALQELAHLGWRVNWSKSNLEPSQKVRYIGYQVETYSDKKVVVLKIPKDRIKKVKMDISQTLEKKCISARALARIAGQCISMTKAVLPAKLLLRNLYICLKTKSSWGDILELDSATLKDLEWWLEAFNYWNGRAYKSECSPVIQIATDASMEGWGCKVVTLDGLEAQGFWDIDMSMKSSNFRDMFAVYLSLMSLLPNIKNKTIQILSDNITTVAYICFQGGPSGELTNIASKIWTLAIKDNVQITAHYLAGKLNIQADALSRLQSQHEWELNPNLYHYLDTVWGPHTIDPFATINTTKCKRYNSRYLDPGCCGVDALHQSDWAREMNFVNAPLRLLDSVLNIILHQEAEATIIAPAWKAKNWFQKLKKLSIASPIKLPHARTFCFQRGLRPPKALKNPKWVWFAWRISGRRH
ncbi:reverse transcriptase [Plakobranchus ocellatus]|uniref:Reverse transcriptase n=1 Tax=Plakobranchus ocellatus TaxID=259542 RepID=A0AAV4AMH4_9GAST|nr:reverse transcriptase [Plakobranchus ocellatus]